MKCESKAPDILQFSSMLLLSERSFGNGLLKNRPSRIAWYKTACWHLRFYSKPRIFPILTEINIELREMSIFSYTHTFLTFIMLFQHCNSTFKIAKDQIPNKYMKWVKIFTHSSIYQVPTVHKDGKNCEYNSKYAKQSTLTGTE